MLPVVTGSIVAFLAKIPPFQFLSPAELASIADSMSLEYFPKDTVILRAGMKASESLYIVQKGGVKLALRTNIGKELILDMRSEGEVFGLLSLMGRDVARLDVTAIEDTLCYTIPAADIQLLMARNAEIADYFLRASITRYMDRSLNELREQNQLMGEGERLLYSLSVADAAGKPAIVCNADTSIRAAARMIADAKATCLFVVDTDGRAAGIITDKDFAQKVVAAGLSVDLPVSRIMTSPVISVDSNERVFQAMIAMLNKDIHHVLVTSDGRPQSVLTNHDLMLLQGKSPLNLVRHIERQTTVEGLAAAQKRIGDLLPLLMREGARASHITRVVAEVNDRVMARILEFAKAELGPAPVPFCWVAMGSEGRLEQTFKTDQDNGLIYADTAGEQAADYFARLAGFVQNALERCGYPPCQGGYMASNPKWRQPVSVWKGYFYHWITTAELLAVQDALIFFDMRPVSGEASLFESVAAENRELLKRSGFFKSILAFITTDAKPPLGFFRTFVVERSGEHKAELDLKQNGTQPIVNAARLFALDAGVEATNTVDRLTALQALPGQEHELFKEMQETFEFLTLLRLECQLRQLRAGGKVSSFVAPDSLSNLQKSLLKQSFQTVAKMQTFLESRFRTAVWAQLNR